MAYKRVSGSPIENWASQGKGTVIEGTFLGLREHESQDFGVQTLVDFQVNGLRRTFGCPAVLRDRLSQLAVNSVVRVEYGGLKDPKKAAGRGNPHMFDVAVWEDAEEETADGDDLPFESKFDKAD